MDQPTAEDALARLEVFIGEWTLHAVGADGTPWPGSGRATFEWDDSHSFVIERSTVDLAEAPDGVCIVGCDAANGTYTQLYSDDRGVCRVYDMTIDEHTWTLQRAGEPFAQRFTATISADRNEIAGTWEAAEDGTTFRTDFHLTYRRVT